MTSPWSDCEQSIEPERICDRSSSEAFVIPERDCDPVTERIQKIVFSFVVLVADPKAFDLVDQVIARFTLVDCGLVEGVVGVFDALPSKRSQKPRGLARPSGWMVFGIVAALVR
jgi:hypothetical protein